MAIANLSYAHVAISLFGSLMSADMGFIIGRRVFPESRLHREEINSGIEPLSRDSESTRIRISFSSSEVEEDNQGNIRLRMNVSEFTERSKRKRRSSLEELSNL